MSVDEARRQILQMVAEKKITPAEAAELMAAVEHGDSEPIAGAQESPAWQSGTTGFVDDDRRNPWERDERNIRDAARETARAAREAGREAARSAQEAQRRLAENARESAREAKQRVKEAAREARSRTHSLGNELSGLGHNVANLVSNIVGKVGGVVGDIDIDMDGVTGHAVEFVDILEGSFAEGVISIAIENANGPVEVHAHDADTGRMELHYRVKAANEAEARGYAQRLVKYTVDDHGIRFVHGVDAGVFRMPANMSVTVVLHLPRTRTYGIDVKTKNGRVEMDGLQMVGSRLETGNGRLAIRGVAGDRLDLSTGNGRIEVMGELGVVRAETGNGRVALAPQGAAVTEWHAKTGNGAIDLNTRELPAEAAVEVRGRTGMGSVELTAPNFQVHEFGGTGSRRLEASRPGTGEQKVTLELTTGIGSVHIE